MAPSPSRSPSPTLSNPKRKALCHGLSIRQPVALTPNSPMKSGGLAFESRDVNLSHKLKIRSRIDKAAAKMVGNLRLRVSLTAHVADDVRIGTHAGHEAVGAVETLLSLCGLLQGFDDAIGFSVKGGEFLFGGGDVHVVGDVVILV